MLRTAARVLHGPLGLHVALLDVGPSTAPVFSNREVPRLASTSRLPNPRPARRASELVALRVVDVERASVIVHRAVCLCSMPV